jgi:hypothetical protein
MTRIKLLTIVIAVSCFFVTPAFATGGTSFNQQNLQQHYGGIAEQGAQNNPTTESGVLSSDLNAAARKRYDNLKEMNVTERERYDNLKAMNATTRERSDNLKAMNAAENLTQDEVDAYIAKENAYSAKENAYIAKENAYSAKKNAHISQDVANKNNLNQVAGTVSRTPPANVSGKAGCDFCYSNNAWQACSSRCAAGTVARTPGTALGY